MEENSEKGYRNMIVYKQFFSDYMLLISYLLSPCSKNINQSAKDRANQSPKVQTNKYACEKASKQCTHTSTQRKQSGKLTKVVPIASIHYFFKTKNETGKNVHFIWKDDKPSQCSRPDMTFAVDLIIII